MQQNHVFLELSVGSDAGRQYARLGNVLDVVRQIADGEALAKVAALDESARVSSAYEQSAPVVRRCFDTAIAEASGWAAAGLDALAAADDPRRRPKAAAARLADELDQSLSDLKKLLRA